MDHKNCANVGHSMPLLVSKSKQTEVRKEKPNKESRTILEKDTKIKQQKNAQTMEECELIPPDGKWGWVVLFGATLVNLLVPGTVKSFGVLFVEFLEVFEASPTSAAWIPALCYFLYSSLGPLSSILSLKFSYRTVTIMGGTSAALGMILSYFAESVTYLYFSYGILVGIGAGLAFPPTVYIVTSYFVKLRGVANGICISGSAIGSIILPPLLRFLLECYGHRGAVLLMGGITLNVWVAALLYQPVSQHMLKVSKKITSNDEIREEEEEEDEAIIEIKPKFMISVEDNSSSMYHLNEKETFLENPETCNGFIRSASSAAVPNYRSYGGGRERKITSQGTRNEVRFGSSRNQLSDSLPLHAVPKTNRAMAIYSQSRLPSAKKSRQRSIPRRSPSTSSFQYVSTPFHGSTLTLQPETFASSFSLKAANCLQKQEEQEPVVKQNTFFDISILSDPLYLVILISNSTSAISNTNFIILLPSYAHTLGFNKNQGALLLSIVSALDLVGRIGGSALSDLDIIPKKWYFISGLFFSGLSLSVLPLAETFTLLGVFCGLFGLTSGVYVGVTAVIMADLLGTERLQSSYGISLFVNGLLQLAGPPLIGLWFQSVCTYVPIFTWLGIVLVVGAATWLIVPFIKKRDPVVLKTVVESL
ncbi:hypothetical protein RI129_012017 [Pyrocoelia pectoralis]|uniref:Uncharacterized protein n=1 Tax=Pyrocoelia pectoralis TaxID=417401 RepID=A0AAN7UY87_9COLE